MSAVLNYFNSNYGKPVLPKIYSPEVGKTLDFLIASFKDEKRENVSRKYGEDQKYSSFSYFNVGNHTNNYNYNVSNNSSKSSDKDNTGRIIAGIAFTVVGLVASYFVGKAYAAKTEADLKLEDLTELRRTHTDTENEVRNMQTQNKFLENKATLVLHMKSLDVAINGAKEIVLDQHRSAVRDIVIRVGFIAAAIIGVIGAVVDAPVLMALGLGIVVVLTAAMLIKSGYETGIDRVTMRKKAKIAEIFENLKHVIDTYNKADKNLPKPQYREGINYQNPVQIPYNFIQSGGPGSYGMEYRAQESLMDYVLPHDFMPSAPPIDA